MLKVAIVLLIRPNRSPNRWLSMVEHHFPTATPIVFSETAQPGTTKVNFTECTYEGNALCHRTRLADRFGNGYKNMCRFWYADAWSQLAEFDVAIRIDDDVNLLRVGDTAVTAAASPRWIKNAHRDVTVGMADLFGIPTPVMPYTNVFAVNLTWLRSSPLVHNWFRVVKKTNCICVNRWGDLPLWGYTLAAVNVPPQPLRGWKYFHGSHHATITS